MKYSATSEEPSHCRSTVRSVKSVVWRYFGGATGRGKDHRVQLHIFPHLNAPADSHSDHQSTLSSNTDSLMGIAHTRGAPPPTLPPRCVCEWQHPYRDVLKGEQTPLSEPILHCLIQEISAILPWNSTSSMSWALCKPSLETNRFPPTPDHDCTK